MSLHSKNNWANMRISLRKNICIAHDIAYAQRGHYLQKKATLTPSLLTKKVVLCLLNTGLVLHYYPSRADGNNRGTRKTNFCFILRYWEGQPLASVGSTPRITCSHQSLRRRFKHGGGVNFLVWAKGKLLTSKECLELGIGGHICMAIVA